MDRRELPFKYRLSALLKIDQWEGRLLGAELRRARQVLEERQKLQREALQRIAQAEAEMRELHQADAAIPLERRQRLSDYLHDQYALAKTRQAEASSAEKLFEQIMMQRQAKQQKIRALEQHEGRERKQHETVQNRLGHREADELWLNIRASRR
jgi:hypothetical protein